MSVLENFKIKKEAKIHTAFFNETVGNEVKCKKPDGTTYGMFIDQFIKRVDKGELVIVKEDAATMEIQFNYVFKSAFN